MPPSDTCAAAAAEEEEEGPEDDATAETEGGNAEECRLESPSTPGCSRLEFDDLTDDDARLFCCDG